MRYPVMSWQSDLKGLVTSLLKEAKKCLHLTKVSNRDGCFTDPEKGS
jgi:hypothetical protein